LKSALFYFLPINHGLRSNYYEIGKLSISVTWPNAECYIANTLFGTFAKFWDYHIHDVVAALKQRSGLRLNFKKSYLGDQKITDCTQDLTGRDALEAAKAKAHSQTANQTPTQ